MLRYATGLVELGTRLFELLVIVSAVFLYGWVIWVIQTSRDQN